MKEGGTQMPGPEPRKLPNDDRLSALEKDIATNEAALKKTIQEESRIERERLHRIGLETSVVGALQRVRIQLAEAADSDRARFENILYEVLLSNPELTDGLSQTEVADGASYLWSPSQPRWFDARRATGPSDAVFARLQNAIWSKRKTPSITDPVEKSLPWYLKLPYRMIRQRAGDLIAKKVEEITSVGGKKKKDAETTPTDLKQKVAPTGEEWNKLYKEYKRIGEEEDKAKKAADEAFADLKKHQNDPEKFKAYEAARTHREALSAQATSLARQMIPDLDARMAAEREAIVAHGPETGTVQPATTMEHGKAASVIKASSDAQWAQLVAGKKGLNGGDVQRWMSAPKRWVYKLFSGAGAGLFGWVGKTALTSYAAAIPGMASVSTTLTVFGTVVPISAPVFLAIAAGIAGWKMFRRGFDLHRTDAFVDAGWEARKSMKRMALWEKQRGKIAPKWGLQVNESHALQKQEEIYQEVAGRWKIFRMHNLPTLIGGLVTGGVFENIHTKGAVAEGLKTMGSNALERGKSGGGWFWDKVTSFFASGQTVAPGTTSADCQTALQQLRTLVPELAELEKLNNLEQANASLGEEIKLRDAEIARLKEQLELAKPAALETPGRAELPRVEQPPTQPPPASETPPSRPRTEFGLTSEERIQALQNILHVKSDNSGVWGAAESVWKNSGFSGPKLTWLTDLVEDYTQDGSAPPNYRQSSYFKRELLEKITDGAASMQTRIPGNTTLRMEHLFGNEAICQSMLDRISQSPFSILSPAEKARAMNIINELFTDSRQLLRILQR